MIGKIEKVPLREIWKSEAKDFTTWLQRNIDVLSQSLDFQISNVEREQSAGIYQVGIETSKGRQNGIGGGYL